MRFSLQPHSLRFALAKLLLCIACMAGGILCAHADDFKVTERVPGGGTVQANLTTSGSTVTLPLSKVSALYGPCYMRIVLMDIKTLEPLYEASKTCFSYDNSKALFQQTDYGLIQFPRCGSTRSQQNVTLTLPNGKAWTELMVAVLYYNVDDFSNYERPKRFILEQNAANQLGIQGTTYTAEADGVTFSSSDMNIKSDPTHFGHVIYYTINQTTTPTKYYTPYEGIVSEPGDFETNAAGLQRQKAHKWEYTLYVEKKAGNKVTLKCPVVSGDALEYGIYWRWYDNNTFRLNSQLSAASSSSLLKKNVRYDESNRSIGLMCCNTTTTNPTFDNSASTIYTLPDDVSDWTGADIAVDCGRYSDWGETFYTWHEPTLSMRYIFHIRPAEEIANNIKAVIKKGTLYEDNRTITVPLLQTGTDASGNAQYSNNTYATLRLDVRDINNYWFYPFQSADIFSSTVTDASFSSTMDKCQSVSWVVMTRVDGELYYKYIAKRENREGDVKYAFHNLYQNEVLGTYTCVSDEAKTYNVSTLETGRDYTIVVYANGYNSSNYDSYHNTTYSEQQTVLHTSPIARFDVYFVSASEPQTDATISEHRTLQHLEDNYTRVGRISFDDYTGMTFDAPTTAYQFGNTTNNSYSGHLTWDNTYYGLVSPELYRLGYNHCNWGNMGMAPLHGDYILVKSANVANVSTTSINGDGNTYRWYYGSSPVVRDRTYINTSGKRSGYFLYIDASDEARPIASLDFEANLCAGATLMFTANVVDLTSGAEAPQLMFKLYGLKTDAHGNVISRNLVQTFASGDFNSFGATSRGVWYQIFAKTFVQPGIQADEYQKFSVSVVNACKNTSGADYAIDDVRFYVANDQVEVLQTSNQTDVCDKKDNGAYLKFRMDYNMVKTFMNVNDRGKPLFFRICDESGKPVETNYPEDERHRVYTDTDGNKYCSFFLSSTDADNADYIDNDVYGYRRLILADMFFELDPQKNYYVSVALPDEHFDATTGIYSYTPDTWGEPSNTCSIYSQIVSISYEDYAITSTNGSATGTYFAECGETELTLNLTAKLSIPDAVYGGRKTIDWKFDWFFASEEVFNECKTELLPMIEHFRAAYPDATSFDPTFDFEDDKMIVGAGTPPMKTDGTKVRSIEDVQDTDTWIFSPDEWMQLMTWTNSGDVTVGNGSLFLINSSTFNRELQVPAEGSMKINLYYIPVKGVYTDPKTGMKYHICTDALPSTVTLAHNSPQLDLGFPEVAYPDEWDGQGKNVRLGLHHLNAFKNGTLLRLPVHGYRDGKKNESASRNNISFEEDNGNNEALAACIRLVATTDPTVDLTALKGNYNIDGPKVGEVVNTIGSKPELSATDSYVVLDFSKNTEKREVITTGDDGTTTTTYEDVTTDITFHEGYEYTFRLTYHDATDVIGSGDAICYGKTDLTFKVIPEYVTWTDAVSYNTNWNNDGNWRRSSKAELNKDTEGQNSDNYQDYGTDVAGVQQAPGKDASKTPQNFVPMKFTKVTIVPGTSAPLLGSFTYDQHEGIITTESLLNPNLDKATDNINYDLMVTEDLTTEGSKQYYDVERFYANTCKDVYFRNNAESTTSTEGELHNQHYLAYQKAWVDFSLPADRWSIFSAPLHNVYAGDFYAPHATAKQQTEAFQPITFGDGTGAYNRVKLPVYQRSWYDADARVVTADGNDYTANVPYSPDSTRVDYVLSEWSHAYNDVEQLYGTAEGYSVRPIPADDEQTWTLFRLPKDDTSFDYYDRKGVKKDGKTGTPADRSLNGKLITTHSASDNPLQLNGVIEVAPTEAQRTQNYYLIGNPYMASLDMERFLNDNVQLLPKYWTIEDGELKAHASDDLGAIAPLQAFFVEASTGTLLANVTFMPSQCATSFSTASTTALTTTSVTLNVKSKHGKSTARIVLDASASDDYNDREDVESIFDSNLSDAPQVYTVSGSRAAAVNRRASLRNVPFGVEADNDDEVTLSLGGLSGLTAPVYLYDAKTDRSQRLTDSTAVTISTNAAGRYFLTSSLKEKEADATALRCYSVTPGHVVAATSADDRLTSIDIYDMTGRFLYSREANTAVQEFLLSRGIYLITLSSEQVPEGRTFKLIVK